MKYLFIIFIFFSVKAVGQNLLPSIGVGALPDNAEPICYVPFYDDPDGTYETPGYQVGDTVNDFTLYDMAGNGITLSDELSNGKYVLLIAGSYTCPVFRNKISKINQIASSYFADVSVFVIYEMEAHPDIDTSLYFGYPNPGSQNTSAGILYRQPVNYGERKDMVNIMSDSMLIFAPILLDGPCNEYLLNYGIAPNNAYLIDTNGIVSVKHGWFDKYPLNMIYDIDSVLGNGSGNPPGTNGTFTFQMSTDTIAYGYPGDVLAVHGDFTNTHTTDDVIIDISRIQNNLPDATWNTAMCVNACLPSSISNYILQLPAGETQQFTFYFFNGSEASADAVVQFTNQNNSSNMFQYHFYGITDSTLSIENYNSNLLSVYPNPFEDKIIINDPEILNFSIRCFDLSGKFISLPLISISDNEMELRTDFLKPGIYFVEACSENKRKVTKLIKY